MAQLNEIIKCWHTKCGELEGGGWAAELLAKQLTVVVFRRQLRSATFRIDLKEQEVHVAHVHLFFNISIATFMNPTGMYQQCRRELIIITSA